MTEPEALEAMIRAMGRTDPNKILAKAALRALLDGGYVVLTDQLEQVGFYGFPQGDEEVQPVFRLASSESPKEPRPYRQGYAPFTSSTGPTEPK